MQIKEFMDLCLGGEKTCEDRFQILSTHRQKIVEQIQQLQQNLCMVDYKLEHYKEIGIFHIDG
jgi:DNA-binding transcriptional MerR regulator